MSLLLKTGINRPLCECPCRAAGLRLKRQTLDAFTAVAQVMSSGGREVSMMVGGDLDVFDPFHRVVVLDSRHAGPCRLEADFIESGASLDSGLGFGLRPSKLGS